MEKLTHYKKLQNPDFLGVYALDSGKDLIATIASVGNEIITGTGGKKEECTVVHFRESIKPMIMNSTNLKMLHKLFKTPFVEKWVGGRIQIYADYNVKFGSETVEGLRIRPTLPAPDKPICGKCENDIAAASGMTAQQVAEFTQRKYGKPLCAKCGAEEKAAKASAASDPLAAQTESTETESKTETEQEGINENDENND